MRRLGLISAALLLSLTLPVFGQRGGYGGGFSSSAGGFHGGFGGRSFSGSYSGARAFGAAPRHFNGSLRSPGFNQGAFRGGAGHRWPYHPYRGWGTAPGYGYGYGAYLWPNLVGYPFGFDFADYDDQDDASAAQQAPDSGADSQVPYAGAYPEVPYPGAYSEEGPPAGDYNQPPPAEVAADKYRPPYQGSAEGSSRSEQPVRPQPATTIVFSNGWPSMQVHNYVVTKTTFYDLDEGKQREVPLGEIDVPATKKANRSAGVNFAPPVS